MPDEQVIRPGASLASAGSLNANVTISTSVRMQGEGRLSIAVIRAAVQEMHDSSPADLGVLQEEVRALRAQLAQPAVIEAVAASAEKHHMPSLARMFRSAAKFTALTIIAAIISGAASTAENSIMGWNPPSITEIQRMSPAQMDELARQIERQLEQQEQSDQQPLAQPGQGSADIPRH
jgi:hypothetical protein